ncbi:pyridoxal-phosphate dependent enzyme [Micromonospora sp. AMSO1212t]|uniref:PLP-dependent cysteine synthase family protein n=1 Tax=Micromonospora sp. AMSO1212t TaxID=2650565 RepID=UPI00124B1A92|nr:pyridoxal-phosphate dependent enzyme [Micromonospora sp. AMSO1212t]KAB1904218.1 pyridoxal-phosphate dependent enzyme [Micromonospora sp. AMSO1212t]
MALTGLHPEFSGDDWGRRATAVLEADRTVEKATPLIRFPFPGESSATMFVKDESARPTGSVKYRFARSLFLHALSRGVIRRGTQLVEATSGNMAVAEAHFARVLGLPFTAVVPGKSSPDRIARIVAQGGTAHRVDPPLAVYENAERLAGQSNGYYLDCLSTLGPAIDADLDDGVPGLPDEILRDFAAQGRPEPAWIVTGAGTGATSRAIGRYLRRHGHATRLAVVDAENSAYFPGWATGCRDYATGMPSRIEGIGRPRMEPAFDPDVVDLVIPVPDVSSVAAMRYLATAGGVAAGPSTGACLWGACHLVNRMSQAGESGAVVIVAADGAEPYRRSYYDDEWVAGKRWDLTEPTLRLERFMRTGDWEAPR